MNDDIDHMGLPHWQAALLRRHQLGTPYLETALRWYIPLVDALLAHQKGAERPLLVAINGSQGSGKTTLGDFLCAALQELHRVSALSLSLDDFYLPRSERLALAQTVHPLLATRGVPGTHDMNLLQQTVQGLLDPASAAGLALPQFDKAMDDRVAQAHWKRVHTPPAIILLEGWCLGATAQSGESLSKPVNDLERSEDADGRWRAYVNEALAADFPPLYACVDQWVMLQAPSFECVYHWRQEQEEKLAAARGGMGGRMLDATALHRFIQHYERLTRHCLATLPPRVHHLFTLDRQREITAYSHRLKVLQ